jgi:hypothetical protein
MIPNLIPPMPINSDKISFEIKFNVSRGIERAFFVNVIYDQNKEAPIGMDFVKFEDEEYMNKASICLHSCVQNKQIRYFIKYVPEGIKPFSLKITICNDCGAPIAYKFIVYSGDLKMYPKMKDIKKIKKQMLEGQDVNIPKAFESQECRIGVK